VIVIIGHSDSIDLEILSRADTPKLSVITRSITIALSVLWIAHLITSISIVSDLSFLMLVGGIGIVHSA